MVSQLGSYFHTSYNPFHTQTPSFNLEEMKKKAETFSRDRQEVLTYIVNILNDSKFQENPQKYISDWTKKRGSSEIYKFPEDSARDFFLTNFNS